MTYIAKPKFKHPGLPTNDLGFTHRDYEGKVSTLCAGCGHDLITASIIEACFELSIEPHRVAKISGIGCSSKTPDYFLGNSHGFNSVHGRMPSVLTGANLANRELIYLGVSGDGDSASIGFGQFAHSIRRGVNMTYIVENNGVYGLTKGQFSATADRGSKSKRGVTNSDNAIDLVAIALQLGASFVARSFSGDKTQLVPLIEAAIKHKGSAFIDVISPCVAFNNHAGSTKSFDYVREHNDAVNRLDVITGREPITVDYAPGSVQVVEQHDGTRLALRKLDADYDVHDRLAAQAFLQKHAAKGQVVTGLLYVDPEAEDLHAHLNTVDAPLNGLEAKDLCPGTVGAGKDQRQPAVAAYSAGLRRERDVAGFEQRLEIGQDLRPAAGDRFDELGALAFELVADRELHRLAAAVRIIVRRLDLHRAARVAFGLQLRLELVAPADDEALARHGLQNFAGIGDAAVLEYRGARTSPASSRIRP